MEDQSTQQPENNGSNNMAKPGLIIAIVIILGIAVFAYSQKGSETEVKDDGQMMEDKTTPETTAPSDSMVTEEKKMATQDGAMMAETKTFTVSGQNFAFSPAEIKVKKGDTVKIIFKNTGGFHDWVLDEFKAKTSQLKDGETAEVTFVADKVGSFEYYCSVGSHRAMGMKGNLIVE